MNKKISIRYHILALVVLFLSANFTNGAEKTKPNEPEFVALQEGVESISGKIYDDGNIIDLKEISFTGHNKIGGIRSETDDSVNVLDLSKLKEIIIKQENYVSPRRYRDKEFILVDTISNNGAITKDLLVPKKIVICGISKKTDMEKAWYLNKVDKVEISNSSNR